mmetsp:Transcript_5083/g.16106  ORF Transcript_5083/g.16106 Transcript_5083/m.16106 type:complete len:279 (-) Transcript_5083:351-1187(-)
MRAHAPRPRPRCPPHGHRTNGGAQVDRQRARGGRCHRAPGRAAQGHRPRLLPVRRKRLVRRGSEVRAPARRRRRRQRPVHPRLLLPARLSRLRRRERGTDGGSFGQGHAADHRHDRPLPLHRDHARAAQLHRWPRRVRRPRPQHRPPDRIRRPVPAALAVQLPKAATVQVHPCVPPGVHSRRGVECAAAQARRDGDGADGRKSRQRRRIAREETLRVASARATGCRWREDRRPPQPQQAAGAAAAARHWCVPAPTCASAADAAPASPRSSTSAARRRV